MAATFTALTVRAVDRLCDDAVAVTFEQPDDPAFDFAPGQSLTLRRVVDGVEHRRSYSLCAPAGAAPRIGVREIPEGLFSRWLGHEVRPGDTVESLPPSGAFRADPSTGGRHVCLAAGSGITPMLSIAASLLAHPDTRVSLVYGNRTTGSVMFADELADLKDAHPDRFDLVHVLSREPRSVDLLSGRLDADRLQRLLTSLVPVGDADHVWICGPHEMVQTARSVLADLGVPAERVHVELFHVDGPPPAPVRPEALVEGATSQVSVTLDGRTSSVPVGLATTILDGAAAVRSDLPYACKGGVCGTCRALVTEGEVDLRRNYALDESEVERGFVLTCQAFPVSGSVAVDFDA